MRDVRDTQHRIRELPFHDRQLFVKRLDFVTDRGHPRLKRLALGFSALAHEQADLLRAGVALCTQQLHLADDLAAPLVQREGLRHGRIGCTQRGHGREHRVAVLAHDFDIEHVLPLLFSLRSHLQGYVEVACLSNIPGPHRGTTPPDGLHYPPFRKLSV